MAHDEIGQRLDRLPLTPVHVWILVIVGLGLFFDLFDVFLSGVLGTVLTSSFGLDKASLPVVLGSSFAGMFVGATCMGFVADRYGRKRAFVINLIVYSLFTLIGAFSMDAHFLIATRFLAGIGIGAQMPLSDSYMSEILPARRRGALMAMAYTLGFVGNPAVALLARIIVPMAPFGIEGWRWLFVFGSLGGLMLWFAQRRLPESPRWLDAVGRSEEARQIVDRIAASSTQVSEEGDLHKGAHGATSLQRAERVPLSVLFSPTYRRRTLMLCVFQIFQPAGYYGFGTLVPLVLAAKGFSVLSSLTYTTIAFIGYPLGSALSVFIVEKIDRRWLIVASALLMAIFGIGMGVSDTAMAIGILGIFYTLISNIFSNAFHILQGEIFPTAVRATAAGSAYGLSRASSAVIPFILVPVLQTFGPTAMFAVIAGAMAVVMLDIAFFAPSTTGKTLEEIAA